MPIANLIRSPFAFLKNSLKTGKERRDEIKAEISRLTDLKARKESTPPRPQISTKEIEEKIKVLEGELEWLEKNKSYGEED